MWLVTAATALEMTACRRQLTGQSSVATLVTGVGPLETAVRLSAWLGRHGKTVRAVANVGIAGAYAAAGRGADVLDLCLARQEVLGDLGASHGQGFARLDEALLDQPGVLELDPALLEMAAAVLRHGGAAPRIGSFVTVSCASGSARRAALLWREFDALCENMEGAAVARVCAQWQLPCLELRCVSNVAGQRDKRRWALAEAADRAGAALARILRHDAEEAGHGR